MDGAYMLHFPHMDKHEMKSSIRKQSLGYILAAFGFVAGLAWNDAIKALIDVAFPLAKEGLVAKFLYAVIATVIVILATIVATRFLREEKK